MRPSRAPSNGRVPRAQPRARADLTQSPGGRRLPPAQWWWRRAPWLFVAGACIFSLLTLSGELTTVAPVNDESAHLEMVRWAVQQIHEGNLVPLDGWFPYLSLGDAQFSHYQSLPHLITAYFSLIFGVDTAVHWAGYLLFALFPLSVYAGSRLLGWSPWAAGGAALVTPLLVSVTGYGYESFSYTWLGNGLWSQEWGMFLLPLAWGLSWRAVNGTGRGKYALAALVVGLTIAMHFLTGYFALLSIGVFVIVVWRGLLPRVGRAALVFGGAALVASWVVVPLITECRVLQPERVQSEHLLAQLVRRASSVRLARHRPDLRRRPVSHCQLVSRPWDRGLRLSLSQGPTSACAARAHGAQPRALLRSPDVRTSS